VFNDEDGVAAVTEVAERLDESIVVAWVEADAGLVENIECARKGRTELGGETDALGFTTRERVGATVQGEVA
jgi:hypothetical protein